MKLAYVRKGSMLYELCQWTFSSYKNTFTVMPKIMFDWIFG